ncbi:MAG: Mut7-C RNAse domain-containing protein [Candidatus Sumerlaeia bacterium]|nr:Mut7-C RNAse domain-containing protein [Candidatus Sumerlaeia bacterium]
MLRFFADDHLGKLARWLRLLGYDTLHFPAIADELLAARAAAESRIVLTRDSSLARRFPDIEVMRLADEDPFRQLAAVVREFHLDCERALFTRCMVCNSLLVDVEKETCREEVPPEAFARCHRFARCSGCGKLYWDGTHYLRMTARIAQLKEELPGIE